MCIHYNIFYFGLIHKVQWKQLIMMNKVKRFTLISLVIFFGSVRLIAQEPDVEKTDSNIVDVGLSIEQISGETETLRQRLVSLKDVLKPSMQTTEVDSILDTSYIEINTKRDSLLTELEVISRRELRNREIQWKNYRKHA